MALEGSLLSGSPLKSVLCPECVYWSPQLPGLGVHTGARDGHALPGGAQRAGPRQGSSKGLPVFLVSPSAWLRLLRESKKRGYMCSVADSLCCTVETNTTL